MRFKAAWSAVLVAAAVSTMSPANACFTIIVGKNVSADGNIIVGHNEDNDGRVMSNQYWVPPAVHKTGEMLQYEPNTAQIPQVEKTLGFWWQQTLHPDGYAFSDGFYNEAGVLITSNNCNLTIEKDEKVKDGGIGYGIRRLLAERATSARDGVKIAIDLVTKYGYRHQGRTYTIADSKEAWQLALLKGGRYLARRVGDNEMTVMSNAFSLGQVDLKDKENVIASPDLVQHAIEKGTYKPAKAGDYSDFNFREAYQLRARIDRPANTERVRAVLYRLTGKDMVQPYNYPESMSIKPERKMSVADVRGLLRQNNPWYTNKSGWKHEMFNETSNSGTFDSAVYVLTKNPLISYSWRTSGRPDSQFSYPQFMLGKPADIQSYLTPEQATKAQFRSVPNDFDYSPDRTVFTFINHQNFLDWDNLAFRKFSDKQRIFEAQAEQDFAIAYERALQLSTVSKEKTVDHMHQFNVESFDKVLGATASEVAQNYKATIAIDASKLSTNDKGNVKVTLFSSKDIDAEGIDPKQTFFGDGYPDGSLNRNLQLTNPTSVEFKDVNGDGKKDAILSFPVKAAVAQTVPGVTTQLYLWTKIEGEPVIAMDTVKIEK